MSNIKIKKIPKKVPLMPWILFYHIYLLSFFFKFSGQNFVREAHNSGMPEEFRKNSKANIQLWLDSYTNSKNRNYRSFGDELSRKAKTWWLESKMDAENITEWIDEQCSVVSQINSESDTNSSESINWYEFVMSRQNLPLSIFLLIFLFL